METALLPLLKCFPSSGFQIITPHGDGNIDTQNTSVVIVHNRFQIITPHGDGNFSSQQLWGLLFELVFKSLPLTGMETLQA